MEVIVIQFVIYEKLLTPSKNADESPEDCLLWLPSCGVIIIIMIIIMIIII